MKIKLIMKFLIIPVLMIPISLNSQTMRISAVGGLHWSQVTGSESWTNRIGGQAGVMISLFRFGDNMTILGEVNGSLQGSGWEASGYEGVTNLVYLNLPFTFRYNFRGGFYGEAGLQPGFLLSAKDKYDGMSEDYMDHMKRFDLGLPLGIGYDFNERIGIGLRVVPGLTDITKDEDEKDSNLVIALRGYYTFGK